MLPSISIIGGTGAEGSGLALRWAYSGYSVTIGSRSLDKALKKFFKQKKYEPKDDCTMLKVRKEMPTWRGQNEQSMALAGIAFAKAYYI